MAYTNKKDRLLQAIRQEKGFTRISNSMERVLMKSNLTLREHKLLMYVISETIGWKERKTNKFEYTNNAIIKATTLTKTNLKKTMLLLRARNIIDFNRTIISLRTDWMNWEVGDDAQTAGEECLHRSKKSDYKDDDKFEEVIDDTFDDDEHQLCVHEL